ncbi:MAG: hypothetical protein K2K94_08450 [Muribaculaceae bacterium]|nr:hypothetical protein [Muribaculaceae bacterium]
MENLKYYKRVLLLFAVLCIDSIAKPENTAYLECRGVIDAHIKMFSGRADNFPPYFVDRFFRIDSVVSANDIDDDDDDWDPDLCEVIHFNVELDHYNVFEEMISYIAKSERSHSDEYIYHIRVNELFPYNKKVDNYVDCININPNGSYRFKVTRFKEVTITDKFLFKQNGLTFSSNQFLTPIYRKVNNSFITDCWGNWSCDEFVQWTFVVLCGRIVDATLLIEYDTSDIVTIDLMKI